MLPIVIPETITTPFKYWLEGVQEGMYYNNELYALVKAYDIDRRDQAYTDACELADNSVQVCITASNLQYCLWQNLKPNTSTPEPPSADQAMRQYQEPERVLISR